MRRDSEKCIGNTKASLGMYREAFICFTFLETLLFV